MKKVSVIIPAYNCEKFINKCINSVVNQTYKEIEIIVVNDGSTDSTQKKLEKLDKNDSRIIVLNKQNGGVSSARNKGIQKACGDYLVFIDSDDFVKKDYIQQLLEKSEQSGESTIYTGYSIISGKKKNIKSYIPSISSVTGNYELENCFNELMDKRFVLSPFAKLYDADIIKKNHILFDESVSIGEDLLFNLQYLQFVNTIVFIRNTYYYYVMSSANSLSKSFDVSRSENSKKLFQKGIVFCKKKQLGDKSRAAFANYYFKSQMILIESLMKKKEKNLDKIIESIMKDRVTANALSECTYKKKELMVYYYTWKSHKMIWVKMLGRIRLFLKSVRGF